MSVLRHVFDHHSHCPQLRLYGEAVKDDQESISATTHVSYRLLDSLPGCTPLRTMVHADLAGPGAPPAVVAAVGRGRSGALAVLRNGLLLDVVSDVPLPGTQGVWAVQQGGPVQQAGPSGKNDPNGTAQPDPPGGPARTLVFLTRQGATQVLDASGEELRAVTEEAAFPTTEPTVHVATVGGGALLLHVGPRGVRYAGWVTVHIGFPRLCGF